ncbi:hypothetical protein C3B47_06190 [Flavobacterium columnare]|uniref:hypothetical protein n=1 Tax=Flavobacterium columnare TaxID=996 RepID=UPI0018965BF7|nr:hypothetical protein [Flavobacterium columnare]MBF6652475.1 hypothetical protein [Flavobacterium columnare]MBF6652482.1 hypothetical protein [Flavobacterium columnare]
MKSNLFLDLGFIIYDSEYFDLLSKKSVKELKELYLSSTSNIVYKENILSNISIVDDEVDFLRSLDFFKEDIPTFKRQEFNVLNYFLSGVSPLNNYFFLEPRFYISANNFNFLNNENSLVSNIYYNDSILKNVDFEYVELIFDTECLIVRGTEFKKQMMNSFELLEKNIHNFSSFDTENYELLKKMTQDFDNQKHNVIIVKSL